MPIANLVHLDASQRREPRHLAFTPERLKLSFTPNVSERQIRGADSPDERLSSLGAVKEAKAIAVRANMPVQLPRSVE